jgi:uncharacterized membrane protein
MPSATHCAVIERPVEAVFAFVADGEQLGRRVAADYEITVCEPNRRIAFQTIAGPVRPRGRYDFEESDGGTRLTLSLHATLGGLRGILMGSMVQRTMNAEVRSLETLKRVLEAEA